MLYLILELNNILFNLIIELNLSNNQIGKLPDQLADLGSLESLDISHNTFLTLPTVVFKMPKLKQLKANDNKIIGKILRKKTFINHTNFLTLDIDTDEIIVSNSLEVVDLRNNPLTPNCHDFLKKVQLSFHIGMWIYFIIFAIHLYLLTVLIHSHYYFYLY